MKNKKSNSKTLSVNENKGKVKGSHKNISPLKSHCENKTHYQRVYDIGFNSGIKKAIEILTQWDKKFRIDYKFPNPYIPFDDIDNLKQLLEKELR